MGQGVAEKVLTMFNEFIADSVTYEKRLCKDLAEHSPAVQFLAVMPTKQMLEFVMQLQNTLTLNIIQGAQVNYNLFTETIKMLDTVNWLNFAFKDKDDQIDKKEFHNDAVNNNLDLRQFMQQWAHRTIQQVRNDLEISPDQTHFNPCDFHWLMTPHVKTCML